MSLFRRSAESGEWLITIYEYVAVIAQPLLYLLLIWRSFARKEIGGRWIERTGVASAPAFRAPAVWVHAASVGELNAIMPLVQRLARLGLGVVVTTVTATSARIAERRLPSNAVHQFAPFDTPAYVTRFLDHWQPELFVTVESEIWPTTLHQLEKRNIPAILANARISERSWKRWQHLGTACQMVFGKIRLCLAQTDADADRYRQLGALRVVMVGNLKFDAPANEAPEDDYIALQEALGGRPMFLAASTHPGEEDGVLFDAAERLIQRVPRILITIAPRHPERSAELVRAAEARGFRVAVRSKGELPGPQTTLYIADTLGELGTLYRCSAVAFVGGSFVPRGGHNPIEAALVRTPVITGPHIANFEDIYRALQAARGVSIVADAHSLVETVTRLIGTKLQRDSQVQAASDVVARLSGGLERTMTALRPFVEPLMLSHRIARHQDLLDTAEGP